MKTARVRTVWKELKEVVGSGDLHVKKINVNKYFMKGSGNFLTKEDEKWTEQGNYVWIRTYFKK